MTDALRDLIATSQKAVVTTIKRDGRPQLSNIVYWYDGGLVRISLTESRAKTANMRRDPRVSLHVTTDDFWRYAVAEGNVELTPVAAAPDDPTVDLLVSYYRAVNGDHPDWNEYRQAMVDDGRLLATLTISHLYGQA